MTDENINSNLKEDENLSINESDSETASDNSTFIQNGKDTAKEHLEYREDFIIRTEKGFNPFQKDGTQNNIYMEEGNNSIHQDQHYHYYTSASSDDENLEYDIDLEELSRIDQVYVNNYHDYLYTENDMNDICEKASQNPVLIVYGHAKTGRFTFTKWLCKNLNKDNVICINESNISTFSNKKWRPNSAYIVRSVNEIKQLAAIIDMLYAKLKSINSYLCFILTEREYMSISDLIYSNSVHIHFPTDRVDFIMKHIAYQAQSNNWLLNKESWLEAIVEKLSSPNTLKRIGAISKTTDLHRLSSEIALLLYKNNSELSTANLEVIIKQFHSNKNWSYIIDNTKTMQEKLLIYVISCLNGIEREALYSAYQSLENILKNNFSKEDKENIINNELWNKTWSERLRIVFSKTMVYEKFNKDGSVSRRNTICLSDDMEPKQIMEYFLEEYSWYPQTRDWLIELARQYTKNNNYESKRKLDIVIQALVNLSENNFEDLLFHLTKKCKHRFEHFIIAKFLREIYNHPYTPEIKSIILKHIHELLISNNTAKNTLGINICTYQFSNIYLNKLLDDILNCYKESNDYELSFSISHCIQTMIFYQEETISSDNSYFKQLYDNKKIWEVNNAKLINLLLYSIVYYYPNTKWYKSYEYPVILYIYGKNIEIRKHIVDFFTKCILNPKTYDNGIGVLEVMFQYTLTNSDIPNLKSIYSLLSSKIKSQNQYCSSMLQGVENKILILYPQ